MAEPPAHTGQGRPLLDGLRVVELGDGIAVGLVGMLLAEHGAEVVRLAGPTPAADPVLGAILGRGKLEAPLDPQTPEGRALVEELAAVADVVVQNETHDGSGTFDATALRAGPNPGLVDCNLAPFPAFDPRADLPAHEAIASAAACLYSKPLGRPQLHDFCIASVTAALYAAIGVVAALIARGKSGRGQRVDTSLFHAGLVAQVLQIFVQAGVPRGFLPLKMVGSPAMRCWECKDKRWVYLHVTMPAHNARILELLAQGGFAAEAERLRAAMSPETLRDPSQFGSIAEAKQIKAIYEEIFRQRTADEWEALLGGELCCIKVREVGEWLADSLAAGMSDACRLDDPLLGELLGPGALVTSPESESRVTPRVVDAEALVALRARWGAGPSPLSGPTPKAAPVGETPPSPPLAGVRVMDLSRIIAGPCAGRVLAELGAEVVSLQSPTRLDWALSFHLVFNAGKKSVTLDFTSDEGKGRLWDVLGDFRPDVFIQNYRHLDVARAAGVGPEKVRERFPGVAYVHLNAYGNHGAWRDRPGFEQVVQAVSGIQLAYARGGRPRLLPTPIIDIGCGLLGALGALLGVYQAQRTGRGAFTTSHLTSVSVLLQLPAIAAAQRAACLGRAAARGANVRFAPEREVLAGIVSRFGTHLCVAGPRGELRRWLEHQGWLHRGEDPAGDELAIVAAHFTPGALRRWQRSLAEAGVQGQVALLSYPRIGGLVAEVRAFDPRPTPFLSRRLYPGCERPLAFMRSPIRMSATPLPEIGPPPLRGTDSEAILGRVGASVGDGCGSVPYPPNKPFFVWLGSLLRWGYFAWKSGNI